MIKKTIILILLSTLFVSCNEGTRYDEPDTPTTTNTTTNNNNPIGTTYSKVDSIEKIAAYKKTYKVSTSDNIDVSIADILATPGFVGVYEIIAYELESRERFGSNYMDYHREYKTYYEELNSYILHVPKPSFTIPEDSILRVSPSDHIVYVFDGSITRDFVVIVKYEVKVKVPKSRVIGAD